MGIKGIGKGYSARYSKAETEITLYIIPHRDKSPPEALLDIIKTALTKRKKAELTPVSFEFAQGFKTKDKYQGETWYLSSSRALLISLGTDDEQWIKTHGEKTIRNFSVADE